MRKIVGYRFFISNKKGEISNDTGPVAVLNDHQYRNKELVSNLKLSGFRVEQQKKVRSAFFYDMKNTWWMIVSMFIIAAAACFIDYQLRIKCVSYDTTTERCLRTELR